MALFEGSKCRRTPPRWLYTEGWVVSSCRTKHCAQVPLGHVANVTHRVPAPWACSLVLCGELCLWTGQSGDQMHSVCHSCSFQGLMQCGSTVCTFINYHMMNMGLYHSRVFLLTKCCAYSQLSLASVFVNFTLKDQHAQDARVHPSLSLSKEISAFLSPQVIWEGEEVHKLIYLELSAVLRMLTTKGVSSSSVVGWLWRRPHSSLKEHWAALESDFPTCSPLTNITITDSLFKVAWSSCQAQAAL